MNFIGVVLALVLVVGAVIGIFVIASNNQRTYYQDTFGNVTSSQQNNTMKALNQTAGPIGAVGGGVALFLGLLSVITAVVFLVKYQPGYSQRK